MGEKDCPTGKQYYRTPQEAVKVRKRLANRRNAHPHENLNHFKCHACDGWHLGQPKKNREVFKSMRAKPGRYQHY